MIGYQNVIPYKKAFNRITGGVIPSILLQQIIYWGTGDGEFYKFIKPCDHPLYNPGDSWIEELGISEYQFSTALKVLMNKLKVVERRRGYGNQYFFKLNREILDPLIDQAYAEEAEEGARNKILRIKKFKNTGIALADGSCGEFYPEEGEESNAIEGADAQNSSVGSIKENSEIKNTQKRNQETPSLETKKVQLSYTETTSETTTETISYIVELREKVVGHLNQVLGSKFKTGTKTTVKQIAARVKEGYVLDDFIFVIDNKFQEWKDDSFMKKFLNPETLFGNKFDNYLNAPDIRVGVTKADTVARAIKSLETIPSPATGMALYNWIKDKPEDEIAYFILSRRVDAKQFAGSTNLTPSEDMLRRVAEMMELNHHENAQEEQIFIEAYQDKGYGQ